MIIIEYFLQASHHGCICCGEFRSWEHFDKFVKLQEYYGKSVSQIRLVNAGTGGSL